MYFVASTVMVMASAAVSPVSHDSWETGDIMFFKLLAVLALVLLNGFFVASEFAIVKIRSSTLDTMIEKGDARASIARLVTSNLEAYLSATQLGVTLASLGLGWIGEPVVARMIEPLFRLAGVSSDAVVHATSFIIAF